MDSPSGNKTLFIVAAVVLALAPFTPEPHLVEKLRMLFQGTLSRPLDIFDLCMHGLPLLFVLGWVLRDALRKGRNRES